MGLVIDLSDYISPVFRVVIKAIDVGKIEAAQAI
jgi:ABC-type arginine transport system permease subunit